MIDGGSQQESTTVEAGTTSAPEASDVDVEVNVDQGPDAVDGVESDLEPESVGEPSPEQAEPSPEQADVERDLAFKEWADAVPKEHANAVEDPLAPKQLEDYTYNMVENPGPLAEMDHNPAASFAGGRYDLVELTEDRVLYRAGDSQGSPLGQFYTTDPPDSVAQVRIDSAVKPYWIDPKTHALPFDPETKTWGGASPLDTMFEVEIPAGTTVYHGPVAYQGGIHVGGGHQVFVPSPWNNPDVTVVWGEPLR